MVAFQDISQGFREGLCTIHRIGCRHGGKSLSKKGEQLKTERKARSHPMENEEGKKKKDKPIPEEELFDELDAMYQRVADIEKRRPQTL
jgi:hypothetical protein